MKRKAGISDVQLDAEVIKCDLPILADCFDNYNDYVDVLGLKPHEHSDARRTEFLENSHRAAMREVLKHWRTSDPSAATYRALLNAIVSMPGKERIAKNICKFIADNIIVTAP